MLLRIFLIIALVVPVACVAREKGSEEPSFYMPVLDGWRTETIPFPLDFAPELKYEGLEELRFSPWMFEEGNNPYFWTYAFVWWIPEDTPVDPGSLAASLEIYFSGLAGTVAETRGFDTSEASYDVSLTEAEIDTEYDYEGSASIFEPFVTGKMLSLNIRVKRIACPDQKRLAIYFGISPQPYSDRVWRPLKGIWEGFLCQCDDPFGAPPRKSGRNCGPEKRLKFDVAISGKDDFVAFLKDNHPALCDSLGETFMQFDDFRDFSKLNAETSSSELPVNWNTVQDSVQVTTFRQRMIYTIQYVPSVCRTFTIRMTNDGYFSHYGCCGK